jgi:hypothetical protein
MLLLASTLLAALSQPSDLKSVEKVAEFCEQVAFRQPDSYLQQVDAVVRAGEFSPEERLEVFRSCAIYAAGKKSVLQRDVANLEAELKANTEKLNSLAGEVVPQQ